MITRPLLTTQAISRYKELAQKHRDKLASREEIEFRDALRGIQPPNAAVTIQVFQPIDRGRLVDVGPRPSSMENVGTIFQPLDEGKTGALFQDALASRRFTPGRESVPPGRGRFSAEQLALEQARYATRTGDWKDGVPRGVKIAQLPLTALPVTLCPKKCERHGDEVLRLPHLGAAYTLLSTEFGDIRKDDYYQTLILYSLCAGQVVHRVRFELMVGARDKHEHKIPEVNRFRAAEGLWDLRQAGHTGAHWHQSRAELVDVCALVGTLILNHHLFFPFDPVAYKLLCALSSQELADQVYYIHRCCPPFLWPEDRIANIPNSSGLLTALVEDIDSILTLYFRDPTRAKRIHPVAKEQYLSLIRGSVLVMLIQLCGDLRKGQSVENRIGDELSEMNGGGKLMWSWLAPSSQFMKLFGGEIQKHSLVYTATGFDKASSKPDSFSDWVLSLLTAGTADRPSGRIHRDEGDFVVAGPGSAPQLADDSHREAVHFLRAHTRAMWNVLKGH